MKKIKINKWVLAKESRKTLSQLIGGDMFDYIVNKSFNQTDGTSKSLLSIIRDETHMGDRTLKHVFRGETHSEIQYERVLVAIKLLMTQSEFFKLAKCMVMDFFAYVDANGEEFLEEQRIKNRPRKFGNSEVRKFGSSEIRKLGSSEVRKFGSSETRKFGNSEIRKVTTIDYNQ